MEPTAAVDNTCRMENEDSDRLSAIIDILNTLDNLPGREQNDAANIAAPSPQDAQLYQQQAQTPQQSPATGASRKSHKPYIKILEQPAGKALRFRYECEGRSAGSIPGINSTPENKTFPSIEIVGYKDVVAIVVSLVTKDPPYRPHPHNLVGKECKNGVCSLVLNGEPMRAVFSNLGIQCVKKKDIKTALDKREYIQVDPFKTKFAHKDQPSSIDLNSVRLCFQAFLKRPEGAKALTPVVSDPIYDKKAMSDLIICRLCSCSAKVGGGDEIILLCEKVAKDDIKVKFFELNADDKMIWEDYAEFQQTDIHKQTAIAFKTPRYRTSEITEKAKVFIQLVRPSDGVTSEPLPFEYYPDPDNFKRKRIKTAGNPMNILRQKLESHEQQQQNVQIFQNDFQDVSIPNANIWNTPWVPAVKTEPMLSPQHFGARRSPYQMSPSPQPLSPMSRIETPSPGLVRAMSAGSQAQMSDAFAFNTLNIQNSPTAYQQQPQQQQQQQQPQQQQQQYLNANPFYANNNNNSNNNNSNINNNNNGFVKSNGMDRLVNHLTNAPNTSGGSITPLYWTQPAQNPPQFPDMNITAQKLQLQQQQPQQQQQQYQQQPSPQMQLNLQHDIDMLPNATSTDEGPTLSGLLAFVDGEQLLNINSEELPLTYLSVSK